jgi:hypothetical protein
MNENVLLVGKNMNLFEDETGATTASTDIAKVNYKVELIETIFQKTIFEQVCDTQPTATPSGLVYSTTRLPSGGIGTKSVAFEVEETKIPSKFTKEWLQDYNHKFGDTGIIKLKKYISWDIKDILEQKFITALNTMAEVQSTVTLGNTNITDEFMKIVAAYNKALAKMASEHKRGYSPYIVCSQKVGAALTTIGQIKFDENDDNVNREFLGWYGRTKVFVDNAASSDYLTIGHFDNMLGGSSLIFCPYVIDDGVVDDYSVEESAVYVLARCKFVRNPFDVSGDGNSIFAKRIPINFSAMTIF